MHAHRALRIPLMEWLVAALILIMVAELVVFIALSWQLLQRSSSQAPVQVDPLEVVNGLHSNINNNDLNGVLDLFAEDAVVTDDGTLFDGKEAIQDWVSHSDRMAGLHLQMLDSQVAGEKVFWNDLARDRLDVQDRACILHWMAVIQHGKIKSLTVSLLPMPDGK